MKNKKGLIEIQFNWIFVLIVGGIMIITVTSVIIKQKNSAESSIRATLLNTLHSLIASSSASSGATTSVSMPKVEVLYECNSFSIAENSKSYNGLVMFGPSSLKGKKLIMQNIVLDMPYRTANFLYASTDDAHYVFVYEPSNNFAKAVDESISSKFKKSKTDSALSEISNDFNYKVRFIFFGTTVDFSNPTLQKFISMPDKDVTAVLVDSAADENIGTVTYYRKNNNAGNYEWKPVSSSVNYFKMPSLIGAIFMDSGEETAEQYNCVMDNALQRMKMVTEFYKRKVESFARADKIPMACKVHYNNLITPTNIFSNIISNLKLSNFANIPPNLKVLADKNAELQSNSCPLIY